MAVILLSVIVTLLLLKNNHISLHQSLNFVQSLSNYPRSETILLDTTVIRRECGQTLDRVRVRTDIGQ